MAKSSKDALGADGARDLFLFEPERLKLVTDEKHPLYDERVHLPVDEALVQSIMFEDTGVIEPVIISKDRETGEILVVDGRQRVKACIEANKRRKKRGEETFQIAVIPKRGEAHILAGISASTFIRQEDTPMGRAKKIAIYLGLGRSDEQAAVRFGVSVATIKNSVKLLDAPAVVRNAVESGKVSVSDGYKLAGLDVAEAKDKVEKLITHAPRTPGKKRSKNAAKARAIVGAGKKKKSKVRVTNGSAVADDRLRAHNVVENVLRELEEKDKSDAGGNALTKGAIVAMQWVLGDDKALKSLGLS